MPKQKTNSGAKKRFKVTGTGRILRRHAMKSHNLEKKTAKRRRGFRRALRLALRRFDPAPARDVVRVGHLGRALSALRPSIRVLDMSGYTDEAIVRTGVLDEGRPPRRPAVRLSSITTRLASLSIASRSIRRLLSSHSGTSSRATTKE